MMKLENYQKVKTLVEQRDQIFIAIRQGESQSGNLDSDFWCYLSMFSDGSGKLVDMIGCYVATEVIQAVLTVLYTKIKQIDKELAEYGVDTSNDKRAEEHKKEEGEMS